MRDAQVFHRHHHFANFGVALRVQVFHLAAHHLFDKLLLRYICYAARRDELPVAHHNNAVRNAEYFVQLVSDENA